MTRLVFILATALTCFSLNVAVAAPLVSGDILVTEHERGVIVVNPTTGNRTLLSGIGVGTGPAFGQIAGIVVAPDGSVLVADEINDAIVRVDPSTGNRSIVSSSLFGVGTGPSLSRPFGLVMDGSGRLIVSDFGNNSLISIDPTTGNRADYSSNLVGSGPNFVFPLPIALAGQNVLVADEGLISVDAVTRNRTVISSQTIGTGPDLFHPNRNEGLVVDAAGRIYVSHMESPDGIGIFLVDPLTGNRSLVSGHAGALFLGTGPAFSSPRGITLDAFGQLLVVDIGLDAVLRIDPTTGNRTVLSNASVGTGPSFSIPIGIAVVPQAEVEVPEPTSILAWLGIGCIVAGAASRRSHLKSLPHSISQ